MKQRGFSLIMAIFLIVVLGGIAVFMGRISSMQHHSSALDEEGAMAYQAARAGIEWGIYQAVQVAPSCVASSSFTLALAIPSGSVNYPVTVTCSQTQKTEGSTTINVYQIESTANNAANGNFYVERRLTVTVTP